MPRASWRGFLRLSLVSCPIYLSPATTRTKPIRLHQVWQPTPVDVDEDDLPDRGEGPRSPGEQNPQRSLRQPPDINFPSSKKEGQPAMEMADKVRRRTAELIPYA